MLAEKVDLRMTDDNQRTTGVIMILSAFALQKFPLYKGGCIIKCNIKSIEFQKKSSLCRGAWSIASLFRAS